MKNKPEPSRLNKATMKMDENNPMWHLSRQNISRQLVRLFNFSGIFFSNFIHTEKTSSVRNSNTRAKGIKASALPLRQVEKDLEVARLTNKATSFRTDVQEKLFTGKSLFPDYKTLALEKVMNIQ